MQLIDFMEKASHFFITLSMINFIKAFFRKEDFTLYKSVYLVLFFTFVGFSATKVFPNVHREIFSTWESWFMFLLFPAGALIGIYLVKTSKD